jgi:hypothetical protein
MAALEKHYTVSEVATLWQLSEDSIRRIFRDKPGVLKLNSPETLKKRGYCVLRIPETVLQKVHAELRGRAA